MEFDFFGTINEEDNNSLRSRFIEPPFSVLDTKTGNWQRRKREWLSRGIKSELGRDSVVIHMDTIEKDKNSTNYVSIFDPALCELMYNWFCPDKGKILDPFAGGSVRGVVAHYLDYYYTGIELRQEQVDANRDNALKILKVNNQPNWYCGDSDLILDDTFNSDFDMIFSCPPYMDLEIYSDDKNDLSNMCDCDFIEKYNSIIRKSVSRLKKGCYAIFVVGDVRDKKTGFYKDFIGITKNAFHKSGMGLYNDVVLLNPIASASMRAGKTFASGKKLTKIHQNVLIFKK